jgi:hypothetical protein
MDMNRRNVITGALALAVVGVVPAVAEASEDHVIQAVFLAGWELFGHAEDTGKSSGIITKSDRFSPHLMIVKVRQKFKERGLKPLLMSAIMLDDKTMRVMVNIKKGPRVFHFTSTPRSFTFDEKFGEDREVRIDLKN